MVQCTVQCIRIVNESILGFQEGRAFAVRNNYSHCRRMRSCQRKRNHSNDEKILRVYMIL